MILDVLRQLLGTALQNGFPECPSLGADLVVTPTHQPELGDYQCNTVFKLAKSLRRPPMEVGAEWVRALRALPEAASIVERFELAAPGFINIRLSNAYVARSVQRILVDARLGVQSLGVSKRAIVEFSSPNVAKEMHVGHLRSTVIGNALANFAEFAGFEVLRLNHIGDWGTQFGMLLQYIQEAYPALWENRLRGATLEQLTEWYKVAKADFDADPDFKKRAQQAVVSLQGKLPVHRAYLENWEAICQISRIAYETVYERLHVRGLKERGESFYHDFIGPLLETLAARGLLTDSEGARCVFMPEFKGRQSGEVQPFILQKSDGGFNYASTDLASLQYRLELEKGDWLVYVVDAGQSLHFEMLFACARKMGLLDPVRVRVDHVPFGVVLRADGKKFKTRSGDTLKLVDLLDEAVSMAGQILKEKVPEQTEDWRNQLKEVLGINAVIYADLSVNRNSDYVFSFDKMLRFEGNTAVFLMYALVRTEGLLKRFGTPASFSSESLIEEEAERALALHLVQFPDTFQKALDELLPSLLCDYLYKLAEKFNLFFHHCRIENHPRQRERLGLTVTSNRVLKTGMQLLGLRTVQEM